MVKNMKNREYNSYREIKKRQKKNKKNRMSSSSRIYRDLKLVKNDGFNNMLDEFKLNGIDVKGFTSHEDLNFTDKPEVKSENVDAKVKRSIIDIILRRKGG